MITGSLVIAFWLHVVFFVAMFLSYFILGKINWLSKEKREIVIKIGDQYVEPVKEVTFLEELRMIFFKNAKWPLIFYLLLLSNSVWLRLPLLHVGWAIAVGFVIVNGGFLGFSAVVVKQLEVPLRIFWAGIIPHMPFEIFGMLSILGHAIWLNRPRSSFDVGPSIIYVIIGVAVIFLAAIIETVVSPKAVALVRSQIPTEG